MRPSRAGTARPVPEEAGSGAGAGRPRAGTVPVLALGGFTAALINTVPIPLLPYLPGLLGTTAEDVSWTVTATLLVAAVCTPISGRLGDMYGKRVVLVWCLGLMVAGSVLCALAPSLPPLIAGRALQGCAAGALPLGLSVMRDVLPEHRLGPALAAMSATVGVGSTVGFPLSAFLSQHADWHVLFWAVTALGAANLGLVLLLVPRDATRAAGRFDWWGAVGLTAGLVSLLLALSKGHRWGWTSAPTLLGLAVAVVALVAWARYELRAASPMVDLRSAASRPVLATNLATLLTGFTMFAISLILPQVLQAPRSTGYGAGLSMVETGLCLSVAGLVMLVVSPLTPRIVRRWGARATLAAGALVMAAGYAAGIPLADGGWWLSVLAVLVGAGLAMAFSATPALIAAATPRSQTAAANGLNSLTRSIGASVSSAVMTALLTATTVTVAHQGQFRSFPSLSGVETALFAAAGSAVAVAFAAWLIAPRGGAGRGTDR